MSWMPEPVDPAVAVLACESCGNLYTMFPDEETACPRCGVSGEITLTWNAWQPPKTLVNSIVRVRYRRLASGAGAGGTPVTVDLTVTHAWFTHFVGETPDGERLLLFNDDNLLVVAVGASAAPPGVRPCGVRTMLRLVEEREREATRDAVASGRDDDDADENDDDDDGGMPAHLEVRGP